VHTSVVYNSSVSGDRSGVGFASSLGFDIECVGRWSFLTPAGIGYRDSLIGICVSTRDFNGVGWIRRRCGGVEKSGEPPTEGMGIAGSPVGDIANPPCWYPKCVHDWSGAGLPLYISGAPGDGELLNRADGEPSWLITGAESGEVSLEAVLW
jgi:hypothetical protein